MTLTVGLMIARQWIVPAAILALAGAAAAVWSYRAGRKDGAWSAAAMALKLIAIQLLGLCLLEPLWTISRPKPGANLLIVLADNSRGLRIKDRGQNQTRAEVLKAALTADNSWLAKLGDTFELRRYCFDAQPARIDDYSNLKFDGQSSALRTSLRTLAERFRGRPVAGIVVLTDGVATDLGDSPDWKGLPPVHTVAVGRDQAGFDVALSSVTVTQSSFEDAPVTIAAEAKTSGLSGRPVIAKLLDESGKTIETHKQPAAADGAAIAFRFLVKPVERGVGFYRVELSAEGGGQEATLENNHRTVAVDRGQNQHRILYVSGRPNWEFKFLNRALAADPHVHMVGMIRIARREPKFDFHAKGTEAVNPLFRGLGKKDEDETERYDQPVIVRFNTQDEKELRDGFPRAAEQLFPYEAVIIDDVESEFFTRDQLGLLEKYVSERGGGVMMLGGAESFAEGAFDRTPLGAMLPVYLEGAAGAPETTNLRLELSREGWLEAWARLRNTETAEQQRLAEMPPFAMINPVRGIKPGASVMATATDPAGVRLPAIVAQRYGKGRAVAVTFGDFWRWGMRDEEARADLEKAWRQLVRYLIADVPQRVELRLEKSSDAAQAMHLKVRLRDESFEPIENASVRMTLQPLGGDAVKIDAEPAGQEAGLYQAVYVPRNAGAFRVTAKAAEGKGKEIGTAAAGWTTDFAADEFASLTPNRALLEHISKQTGGQAVALADVGSLASNLPDVAAPIMQTITQPLWHAAWVFALAVACLLAEWALRRWRGLA